MIGSTSKPTHLHQSEEKKENNHKNIALAKSKSAKEQILHQITNRCRQDDQSRVSQVACSCDHK